MPLPSSSMQISKVFEEVTNNEFVQQFSTLNITFTDDDTQNWMSCDGSGYEHLDNQGIVSLISGDYEKQTDEEVEDDNDDQHTPNTHSLTVKQCRK